MKNSKIQITVITLLLIYTLVGFIGIPKFLKPKIIDAINDNITQKASIEKLEFNPFLLKLTIEGFSIKNKKETTFTLRKAVLDFALLTSIDKKHINFKNLLLENPVVNIVEYEDGTFNFENLLKPSKKETKVKEEKSSKPIPFQFYKTAIKGAKIEFTKYSKNKKEIKYLVHDFNYTFYDMGTFKNILASHTLDLKINKNADLSIKGGLRLTPFKMYGNVELTNLKPAQFLEYKKELVNFDLNKDATINLNFGYKVDTSKGIKIDIDHANLKLTNLDIKKENKNLLALDSFELKNLFLQYPKNSIDIEKIAFLGIKSNIKRDKKGEFNFSNLLNIKDDKKKIVKEEKVDKSNPWNISLKEFQIANSNLNFKDKGLDTSFKNIALVLEELKIKNKDLNLQNLDLKLKESQIAQGSNDITIKNFDLKAKNSSFVNNKFKVEKASINRPTIKLFDKKSNREISAKGITILVDNLENIKDRTKVKRVELKEPNLKLVDNLTKTNITAKNIDININKIEHSNNTLKIANSSVKKPYFEITLGKKQKNKKAKEEPKKEEKVVKNEAKKSSFNFDVGPLKIIDMRMVFQDKNLPIPFKTDVTKLKGEFSRLNSNSSKPTKLKLEGQVDKYGYTKITGRVDINDIKLLTDTNVIFKNIAIKNFTPYSGKFVGREIDSGKLNLDLKYNIKKSDLDAQNSIIISDIKLGEKVESPDAANLPLEFAIALLEDSNGVIDIDLPIKGNVDDPQFSVAPIVWKAFTNLIVKAVTAPFSLLASLFGIDEEKLKEVDFEYGASAILASEKESLDAIAKVLSKKPKLAITIEPIYNSLKDKKALQDIKLEKILDEKMKSVKGKDPYRVALEELYSKLENKKSLEELNKIFTKIDKNKKEYFDKEDYIEYLKDILSLQQKVEEKELIALANSRVENIKEYLLKIKKLPKEAINFKDIFSTNSEKDKWAQFKITLSTK